jgi:NADPH:quinone reductase-like Zn-dependent oxidoreductase
LISVILGKIIDYGVIKEPPTILGYDVAGEVVDVGPEVDQYKKGDRMLHRVLAITNE